MLKSLAIKNFRGIKSLELEDLNQINIFVGENGAGKTTILDAIFIGINPNNAELAFRTNLFRGLGNIDEDFWRSYFYNLDIKNTIEIDFSGKYARKISIKPNFYTKETITIKKDEKEEKSETGFTTTATAEMKNLNGLKINFNKSDKKYESKIYQDPKGVKVDWRGDANYQELLSGNYINNHTVAGNIDMINKFAEISTAKKEDIVLEMLQKLELNIENIESHATKGIVARDKRFPRKASINIYGDGILRCMNIICNVLPYDSGITLIDEIENGLHINSREKVWSVVFDLLRQKKDRQIFATTHSYEAVESLFRVAIQQKEEGIITIYRLQKNRKGELEVVKYSGDKLKHTIEGEFELR